MVVDGPERRRREDVGPENPGVDDAEEIVVRYAGQRGKRIPERGDLDPALACPLRGERMRGDEAAQRVAPFEKDLGAPDGEGRFADDPELILKRHVAASRRRVGRGR